jgi:hypothetical protein
MMAVDHQGLFLADKSIIVKPRWREPGRDDPAPFESLKNRVGSNNEAPFHHIYLSTVHHLFYLSIVAGRTLAGFSPGPRLEMRFG